jgi:hypothetical protein
MRAPRYAAALLVLAAALVVALVLSGVTAARTETFQSAYCNYATAQPTVNFTRDGAQTYSLIAAWEGYQWGGGCWNNNNVDQSYGDPPGQLWTGGEGGDCSGLTFKTWHESLNTGDGGHYYWAPLRNVHGPYSAQAFKYGSGVPNGTIYKPYAGVMDGFASDYHVGMIFFRGSGGWDQIIEAKCELCGTNIFSRTYRSSSDYGGIRRLGWTG